MMLEKLQNMQGELKGEEQVYVGDTSRLMADETPITYRSEYSGPSDVPVTISNSNEDTVLKESLSKGTSRKAACRGALDKHKVEASSKRDGKYSV
jgi:hypothetical protein